MGLDLVELVIKVEETFTIQINDRDASEIITVGQLYRYVLERVAVQEGDPCLTSRAFYGLRRSFQTELGVSRDRVRPRADIEELLPRPGRKQHWESLGEALRVHLPDLRRPSWLQDVLGWCVIATGLTLFLGILLFAGFSSVLGMGGFITYLFLALTLVLLNVLAFALTSPFAIELPAHCRSVRGLVETAVASGCMAAEPNDRRWSRATVWVALRLVIVDVLGVHPEEVTDNARFVADFGAG
jgi:hypothetical protein